MWVMWISCIARNATPQAIPDGPACHSCKLLPRLRWPLGRWVAGRGPCTEKLWCCPRPSMRTMPRRSPSFFLIRCWSPQHEPADLGKPLHILTFTRVRVARIRAAGRQSAVRSCGSPQTPFCGMKSTAAFECSKCATRSPTGQSAASLLWEGCLLEPHYTSQMRVDDKLLFPNRKIGILQLHDIP